MVLEIIANKHGVEIFPGSSVSDVLKLQNAIMSATLNGKDYIILERTLATADAVNDAEFQELLDLMDGNGLQIYRKKHDTYVRFSKDEVITAAIEDIT